jgi:MFS family permease
MIILLGSVSANLTVPIWPLYISALGASPAELGYVFAISNAVLAFTPLVGGILSDRYGRKKTNVIGTLLGIFPPLFYVFAKTWLDLIPWVLINSLATALYSPIRWVIVADYSAAEKRAVTYSWMTSAFLLGATIAPFLGGLIADFLGISATFVLSFVLMFLCFILSLLLQEQKKTINGQTLPTKEKTKDQPFFVIAFILCMLFLVQAIGLSITVPLTPIFVQRQFMVKYTEVGILYSVGIGLSGLIVQIPGGKLGAKYSERKLIVLATMSSAVFLGLFALSRNLMESVVLMFLAYCFVNIQWPAQQDIMVKLSPPNRWGLINGLLATFSGIGATVGSAISGLIWDNLGMFFPYYICALMVFLSAIPVIFLRETNHNGRNV